MEGFPKAWDQFERAYLRNSIFMDRTIGVGASLAEKAINYGFTRPYLRVTGIDYNICVIKPNTSYVDFNFDVPVGSGGDTYNRFCVLCGEVKESLKIIRQAIDNLPDGEYPADIPDYYLPPKDEVYTSMGALINNFKIVMGEVPVPVGEVYHSVEGANRELGMYLITDGLRAPFRLHFRRPCFVYYQAFSEMIKEGMILDAVATLSSIIFIP